MENRTLDWKNWAEPGSRWAYRGAELVVAKSTPNTAYSTYQWWDALELGHLGVDVSPYRRSSNTQALVVGVTEETALVNQMIDTFKSELSPTCRCIAAGVVAPSTVNSGAEATWYLATTTVGCGLQRRV